MSRHLIRILSSTLLVVSVAATASAQNGLAAKANGLQPSTPTAAGNESDRMRDGLLGPVRRIRTEVAKLGSSGRAADDDKRVLLETAEYDLKGAKTQNQYFPVAGGSLTGRETYKYDEKGNISEMTLVNADGSLVSKEVYKYDYDSVGNWVKMTTSVAVVGNGKIEFEPTETTYRTIFYYLDAAMSKMMESASSGTSSTPDPAAKSVDPNQATGTRVANPVGNPARPDSEKKLAAALPPATAVLDKTHLPTAQPTLTETVGATNPSKPIVVADNNAPPPPRPLLRPVSGGVLNSKAVSLPAPLYPDAARRMRTVGLVEVEVVVDENGKVISAHALSGPTTLRDVAVQAALRARFTPTKLSGQPMKITGQINYNFTLAP